MKFHRSTFSVADRACVEVAHPTPNVVLVRDSKTPPGPVLEFTGAEWDAFLAGVAAGEFDPEALEDQS